MLIINAYNDDNKVDVFNGYKKNGPQKRIRENTKKKINPIQQRRRTKKEKISPFNKKQKLRMRTPKGLHNTSSRREKLEEGKQKKKKNHKI